MQARNVLSAVMFGLLTCLLLFTCQGVSWMGIVIAPGIQSLPKLGELCIVVMPSFILSALTLMLATESNGSLSTAGYTSSFMFTGVVLGVLCTPMQMQRLPLQSTDLVSDLVYASSIEAPTAFFLQGPLEPSADLLSHQAWNSAPWRRPSRR